jgi:hypothetical protein
MVAAAHTPAASSAELRKDAALEGKSRFPNGAESSPMVSNSVTC